MKREFLFRTSASSHVSVNAWPKFAPVFEERGIPYFVTSERPTLAGAPQIPIALELLSSSVSAGAEPSRDLQLNPDVKWSGADVPITGWAASARWNAHLDWCRRVLQERVRPASDESARVWAILLNEMKRLADFDRLGEEVAWDEFLSALRGALAAVARAVEALVGPASASPCFTPKRPAAFRSTWCFSPAWKSACSRASCARILFFAIPPAA